MAQSVTVTAGGDLLIEGGVGAVYQGQIAGDVGNGSWTGGDLLLEGGTTAVLLRETRRNVTVFINGVDRTEYVAIPIRRSVQVGAAGGTCTLLVNNHRRAGWRPSKFDEVIVYVGTYRFFCGFVNTCDENAYSGTSGLYELTANCLSMGSFLDFVFVGRHYEIYDGALIGIVMYDLVSRYLADRGITWGGTGGYVQTDIIPPTTFNWDSMRQVCQKIADQFTLDYFVDAYKVLAMAPKDTAVNDAPFAIATNNGLWKRMTVTRGGGYANRVGVRNSQDLGSIWTDPFTAAAGQPIFITNAELKARPVVLVDGVAEAVTEPGMYGAPWKWYWLSFAIVRNPAYPLAGGEVIEIKYPSSLSYVAWWPPLGTVDAEITAHGEWQALIEVKDIISRDQLLLIAKGERDRRVADITTVAIETDELGLEPLQKLAIDTLRPPVSDDFLISQVDSEEVGLGGANPRVSKTAPVKGFFSHVARASNATSQRRTSGVALWQKVLDQANQAKDRITYSIAFLLAETINGQTNVGLAVGIPVCPVRVAPKAGIAKQCTLFFQSSTTVLTDTDCVVDMLMNGVTIFPAGTPAKMVWPAGATMTQVTFIFADDPLDIPEGAIFLPSVLLADAKAKDGTLELLVQG